MVVGADNDPASKPRSAIGDSKRQAYIVLAIMFFPEKRVNRIQCSSSDESTRRLYRPTVPRDTSIFGSPKKNLCSSPCT